MKMYAVRHIYDEGENVLFISANKDRAMQVFNEQIDLHLTSTGETTELDSFETDVELYWTTILVAKLTVNIEDCRPENEQEDESTEVISIDVDMRCRTRDAGLADFENLKPETEEQAKRRRIKEGHW